MDSVADILRRGRSYRSDDILDVSHAALAAAETAASRPLPELYMHFIDLGGLPELAFEHRILSPNEIAACVQSVAHHNLLPFASNGCGDLFCFDANDAVTFWDHETDSISHAFDSFIHAIDAWRRP